MGCVIWLARRATSQVLVLWTMYSVGVHMAAARSFAYSFTSGYSFGARGDVMYEQLLHKQEVGLV